MARIRACADMGERQQQHLERDLVTIVGAAGQPGDEALVFGRHGLRDIIDGLLTGRAPQRPEGFAFDFPAEQGADAGAGEPEAQLIDEIRGQHESVAEFMPDGGRIDIERVPAPAGRRAFRSSIRKAYG